MSNFNDAWLDALETSCRLGDDCDNVLVQRAVDELRALRDKERVLSDTIERQVAYIKELRRLYGREAHDFEPEID